MTVDENTIGVVPILGETYTGLYEPVAAIAKALDDLQERTGLDIPMHVDAASRIYSTVSSTRFSLGFSVAEGEVHQCIGT